MGRSSSLGNFFSLQPEQKQQFSLAMKESLDILQMPIEELSSWLEKQIEQNPVLNWKDTPRKKKGPPPIQELQIAYEPSLFEFLMQQARQYIHDPQSLQQMEWIIGNLENTGFFLLSFDTAPKQWDPKELSFLLEQLQHFDPPGIGARNLQESLLLQLKACGKEGSLSYTVIHQHLDDLLQGRISEIQKKCQATPKALEHAIYTEIASLDPFPGLRFEKNRNLFAIPDVFLVEEEHQWDIEINEDRLPSYSIESFLWKTDLIQEEEILFLKKHLIEAKRIKQLIQKRGETLYKVSKYIAKVQMEYLKGDTAALRPLKMKEVAHELDLHESTVARAVQSKYIACKRGVIPLKTLFSKQLGQIEENVSSDQAQKLLLQLVAEENKKRPLSDREILEKMREAGIPCARRTVTKYRQTLHIPSKRFRKKEVFSGP